MSTELRTESEAQPLHVLVAANVRAEMARAGISQARVAEALHTSQQSVSQKRSGRTPFSLNDLEVVAPLLGLTVAELIDGRRSPNPAGPVLALQPTDLRGTPAGVISILDRIPSASAAEPDGQLGTVTQMRAAVAP